MSSTATLAATATAGAAKQLDVRRLQSFEVQQRQLRWPILVAVALVALVVSRQAPWPLVAAWAAVAVLVREWRSSWLGRLSANTDVPIRSRLNRLVLSNVVLGFSHGLAAVFLFWLDTTHAALLTAIFLGWTAGAAATSAPLRRAYVGYALSILGPLAMAWVTLVQAPLGLLVALLIALTTGAQLRFLRLNAELFEESFRMRLENEDLVRQLAAARDVAVAGNHAKSRFLAAASHDLRQPLHALILQIGLLEADPRAPEAPDIVREIGELTHSLAQLLDSLLDISKLDAGVVAAETRPLHLHRLLSQLARGHEPQAAARGLKLRLECPPDTNVVSDPLLLERVLRNLLDNALKYTQHGEIVIVAQEAVDGVTITVSDTGRGIPAEAQHRVFDEFYRVDVGSPQREHGLGLGLSIVRRLAQLLDTTVELRSEPGRGTSVTLRLPAAAVQEEGAAVREVAGGRLPATKVLVVDDQVAVRRAMRHALERFGCLVAEAESSNEAVVRSKQFEPDLVLADCRLSEHDSGFDAIRRLREWRPGLPAVLISGDTDTALRRRAAAAGLPLLHKPVTLERLAEAVRMALDWEPAGDGGVDPVGRP